MVEKAIRKEDYHTAIRMLEYTLEENPQNITVTNTLERVKNTYQEKALDEANTYARIGKLDEAIFILKDAQSVLGGNSEIGLTLNALQAEAQRQANSNDSSYDDSSYPGDNYSDNNSTQDDYYILPDSWWKPLTDQDLAGLSKEELMLARNEIYARHGRIFEDADVRNYFEAQLWYYGYIEPEDFDYAELSQVEVDNVNFIKTYEDSIR